MYDWQQPVWESISRVIGNDHMPHAILLTGPEYCGKYDFARGFAQSLLCESRAATTQLACGQCKSCHLFDAGSHPDFTSIELAEKKTQIVVDQIRELNAFIYLSRSYQESRVAIISPVERLNVNAANSLLKTLEEPPEKTVLLLVSSNPSELLPTIRSRCQILHLPQPSGAQAMAWLETQGLQHPADELLLAASGKPLLARLLDSEDRLATRKQFAADVLKMLRGSLSLVSVAKHWEKAQKHELLDWQLQWVDAMIRRLHLPEGEGEDAISPHLAKFLNGSQAGLWELRDGLMELKSHAHTSLNALLFTENMLVLWQRQALSK
ncbi:MAG: DNA polymerase III subunit delta' [Proteobacteria bacterium]|nr:MAG: DNA polymerase III subunit delta' [Pseudomonadota bacterium]